MKTIKLEILKKPVTYNINIGKGLLSNIANLITKINTHNQFAVLYDKNLESNYLHVIKQQLNKISNNILFISIDTSLNKKSFDLFIEIQDQLINHNINNNTLIISFGGGSVGDLSGFIASTYHRGIDYIQIPTTLLSMIDSSIGGKTGIDFDVGKNLVGTYYHPKVVIIDTDFLSTLDINEINSGYFEVIKYALAFDVKLYDFIINNFKKLDNIKILDEIIRWCCKIKSEIIAQDEQDDNIRQRLNFGHTIGHSIESIYNIRHGEAVGFGILCGSYISIQMGTLSIDQYSDIVSLIHKFKIPKIQFDSGKIFNGIKKDK